MTQAYPLQWPEGWPRTPAEKRDGDARFRTGTAFESDGVGGHRYVGKKPLSFDTARKSLTAELGRMNATNAVLSTNVPVRLDGYPLASAAGRRMDDPGVAIYFTLNKKQMVMAQDAFLNVAANIRSLALAVSALRQLERHGGGMMMERAFSGFVAIAPPDWKKPWREVFGLKPELKVTLAEIVSLYRQRATRLHPDQGGNDTLMAELNVAYVEAKKELGA